MTAGTMEEMVEHALAGDALSLARLARVLDDGGREAAGKILARLYPLAGHAHIVGVTGPPGAGKSTLVSLLIGLARKENRQVGVLAVDPTSPFTGGAVLGDRIRMQEHAADPGVFIRSLATRGHWGGLAASVPSLLVLLDAAGYDLILVETVGVGQDEVEVAEHSHTRVLVTVPGMGDGIQAIKAGVLEIADLYVVNKADRPEAESAVRELTAMLAMAERKGLWERPVLTSVASRGEGVGEVYGAVLRHREYLARSGELEDWRRASVRREIETALREALGERARAAMEKGGKDLEADLDKVLSRKTDPASVAWKWSKRV